MKKYLFFLTFNFFVSFTFGNVIIPGAQISEIFVDDLGEWTIEMGYYYWDFFDSIKVVTSSGNSKIAFYSAIPGQGFPSYDSIAIITNSNLLNPISINPNGDFVKLVSYVLGEEGIDSVAFGDYPGSQLDCIHAGESVIQINYIQNIEYGYYANSFCIDASPTVGYDNDTTGAMGDFFGKIYDLDGTVFTEGIFLIGLRNVVFQITPDGAFLEKLCSRRYTFNTVSVLTLPPNPTIKVYTVEPVDFCLRPYSSYFQDIITTSLITNIKEKGENYENSVIIFPNPFTTKVGFYFESDIFNTADEIKLVISNFEGKILKETKLSVNQKRYDWVPDKSVPPGVLIFHLIKNNQQILSGKFIKQ